MILEHLPLVVTRKSKTAQRKQECIARSPKFSNVCRMLHYLQILPYGSAVHAVFVNIYILRGRRNPVTCSICDSHRGPSRRQYTGAYCVALYKLGATQHFYRYAIQLQLLVSWFGRLLGFGIDLASGSNLRK